MRWHRNVIPEREKELRLFQSRSFRNATEGGRLLLIAVMASAMCVVAPLVALMAVLCLSFTYLSLRYRLL